MEIRWKKGKVNLRGKWCDGEMTVEWYRKKWREVEATRRSPLILAYSLNAPKQFQLRILIRIELQFFAPFRAFICPRFYPPLLSYKRITDCNVTGSARGDDAVFL